MRKISKKKKYLMLIISVLMLVNISTGFISVESVRLSHDTIDIPYNYPIKPESPEWEEFTDHQQMVDACEIPENILHAMTTEALVETVLKYPLFVDFYAYDSWQYGFETVANHSNGITELLNRPDAGKYLVGALKKQEINDISASRRMNFLEVLISQPVIVNSMDLEDKRYLSDFMTAKYGEQPSTAATYYRMLAEQANGGALTDGIIPRISVYTPKGTSVTVIIREETMYEPYLHQRIEDVTGPYPRATILKYPTSTYNCHSYAWYSQLQADNSAIQRYWMNDPSPYWGDRSYIPVAVPKVNDKIYYSSDHSGVVIDATRRLVHSKWGDGCLVQHTETYCPYWYSGVNKTYYMRSY